MQDGTDKVKEARVREDVHIVHLEWLGSALLAFYFGSRISSYVGLTGYWMPFGHGADRKKINMVICQKICHQEYLRASAHTKIASDGLKCVMCVISRRFSPTSKAPR